MITLPQLIDKDIHWIDRELRRLIKQTEATTALVIDQGGFLIVSAGDETEFDLTTIAALASGAYLANQTIANLVREENFDCVYQQGQRFSMLVVSVGEFCLLVIIFKAAVGVGLVKYYAATAVSHILRQMRVAEARAPGEGVDLSVLNVADPRDMFRRQTGEA
jgi:predicted regulator of Ras-like GTPase activity (Roadblock/LC7/MglB family)